ncbi:MAG TPA: hypothetical protein VJ933_07940 [Phaeodactylibacter sp.]|nr:hypothetical protein [Phaeodactylibacter sp.]
MMKRIKYLNVILVCLLLASIGWAQEGSIPEIKVRLNNPQFDKSSGELAVDLELQSEVVGEQPFGMNVRLFYDNTQMGFLSLEGLPDGYDLLGGPPKTHTGNSSSGYNLFRMSEAATFINGAVQLMENDKAIDIPAFGWTKFFELHFQLTQRALTESEELLFPTLVLDSKGDNRGGFLPGEEGIVLTLVEQDPETRLESKPSIIATDNFNWSYDGSEELPFGEPVEEVGVNTNVSLTSTYGQVGEGGYALFQNIPNPVKDETSIGFSIPRAEEVTIRFFDIKGAEVGAVSGDFPAGQNSLDVSEASILSQANVLLYRMETEDYVSPSLRMLIFDQ